MAEIYVNAEIQVEVSIDDLGCDTATTDLVRDEVGNSAYLYVHVEDSIEVDDQDLINVAVDDLAYTFSPQEIAKLLKGWCNYRADPGKTHPDLEKAVKELHAHLDDDLRRKLGMFTDLEALASAGRGSV